VVSSNAAKKDVAAIVRRVRRLPGWTVEHGRHIKFRLDGAVVAVAPSSPSDPRTAANLKADLKRKGGPL
jgi:hypothetical protein